MTPWKQLLRAHEARNGDALTLPFLIGALELSGRNSWAETDPKGKLLALLRCFLDEAASTDITYVFRCPRLGQPVAQLQPHGYKWSGLGFTSSVQDRTTLWVDEGLPIRVDASVEDLAGVLADELGAAIAAGRYSFSGDSYHRFDAPDRAFILKNIPAAPERS